MKLTFDQFILKTNILDKILITLIFFFPLFLSISIFVADLSASIIAIIILILILKKKNIEIFNGIEKEIYFFSAFYILILISLIFSVSLKESFLASFFYFRFFLFALGIFYFLNKYDFFQKILLYSICFTFIIVLSDSIFQYIFKVNFFNYPIKHYGVENILTSFFDEEKKLGSYLIRLLPFLISLLYFFNIKKINYLYFAFSGIIIFFTSERVALFLFIIFSIFYFFVIKKKIQFFLCGLIILSSLIIFNKDFRYQYFTHTLMQVGYIKTEWNTLYNDKLRFYSKEHEDFVYTAYKIFTKYKLTGSGVKTFYITCENLKNENNTQLLKTDTTKNKRKNNLKCSTHPHNTYLQILSETGILTFIFVFIFFLFVLKKNINILFKKNINNINLSYYFLNVGVILNLFPLIPSGSFYNNWLSLIFFYPIGFWLYIKKKNES